MWLRIIVKRVLWREVNFIGALVRVRVLNSTFSRLKTGELRLNAWFFPFSRMPSSTHWCTTPSRRPCWPIRARSGWGTSTRPTSQTSWKKVKHLLNNHRRIYHSYVLTDGRIKGHRMLYWSVRAVRPSIQFFPPWFCTQGGCCGRSLSQVTSWTRYDFHYRDKQSSTTVPFTATCQGEDLQLVKL